MALIVAFGLRRERVRQQEAADGDNTAIGDNHTQAICCLLPPGRKSPFTVNSLLFHQRRWNPIIWTN